MKVLGRIEKIIKLVEDHKPELLEDQDFRKWVHFLQVDPDEEVMEMFEEAILSQIGERMIHPLIVDLPVEMTFPTGIHLGRCMNNKEVFIPPEWLSRNMLISGETGSGKTNTLKYLAKQLPAQGVKVWIFDFKNEYRDLKNNGYEVIAWQELRLNPLNMLDPENPVTNAKLFQRIFGHSQGLWLASQAFLGDILYELYNGYHSFEGKSYPCLHDLLELVKAIKIRPFGPQRDYKERVINRLSDILKWEGIVFNCSRGFPIEDLTKENIVFELRGIKPQTMSLISECLMASLYEFWVARGPQNRLHNMIISDEAKHIFDIRKQYRLKDERPYVDEILAETRSFGIGLILADQQPTELTPSVESNTHTKLEMQLSSGKDIRAMNISMGLSARQIKQSYRISLGEAIAKITGRDPFKVKVPLFRPSKSFSF